MSAPRLRLSASGSGQAPAGCSRRGPGLDWKQPMPKRTVTGSGTALRSMRRFWHLPDRQLDRFLTMVGQVDSVELKCLVPADRCAAVCTALGVHVSTAVAQRVYYLDTPQRTLERFGVVVRVRRIGRQAGDVVVKLRPVDPERIPDTLRARQEFRVEVDLLPGRYVCSGALKTNRTGRDIRGVVETGRSWRRLFSRRQLSLLASHLPRQVSLDQLTAFGPIEVRRNSTAVPGLPRQLHVERWRFPDGSQLLELSTRCRNREALRVAARAAELLDDLDVPVSQRQQTKTRVTLDYFSSRRRR